MKFAALLLLASISMIAGSPTKADVGKAAGNIFHDIDNLSHGNGKIDAKELMYALKWIGSNSITEKEAEELIKKVSGKTVITLNDVTNPEHLVKFIFALFDLDHNDKLTKEDLEVVIQKSQKE